MATNPADVAPGAEPNDDETQIDPNAAPSAAEGEGGNDDEPTPYDDLAQKIGWVPKAQYQGDPAQWKPAEQFILDGREIQRNTAHELKGLRQTVENIGKTTSVIIDQEVNRRVAELTDRYNAAVEDGDATKAFNLASEIHKVQATPTTTSSGPPPESLAFADRNKGWFQKDPLATTLAIDICNNLAAKGYDTATQLDAAEKEVRRQYPHLFGLNGKQQAGVHQPGARGPAPNSGGRAKGFADMPAEAQRVANDMVSRGVIKAPTPDEAKALYAKNYWLNAGGKA